jgi:hypothetical protein
MRRFSHSADSAAASVFLFLLLLLGLGLSMGACRGNQVGRQCILPSLGDAGASQTVVGSPALECQSRTCLHIAGASPDLCTAECDSADDCEASAETPCHTGFVCAVPVVVGPFCCKKFCICKDFNPSLDLPAACDAANANNECCNLPGREDRPVCK